ncbi:hypothetical protein C8R44DRAFT_953092, partial [Mycena epipterygia]
MGTAIHILHHAAALEALHNSADSFQERKWHPDTRKELLDHLWSWSAGSGSGNRLLWLHGPAGAGKSAIAQAFSERLEVAGRLGGSFFFKRDHPTRGNAKALFSTLAYQLALLIPWLKARIMQKVEDDPSIIGRSMEIQLQQLILEPCQSVDHNDIFRSVIIIIDGLDECEDQNIQQEILYLLGKYCTGHDGATPPLYFLISSRPESHIQESFA